MTKYLSCRGIEVAGWLVGLALAAGADYVLVPRLAEQTGQMALAVFVGLLVGVTIVFACGEVPQRLTEALRANRGHTKVRQRPRRPAPVVQTSWTTRIFTVLVLLTIVALVLGTLGPAQPGEAPIGLSP